MMKKVLATALLLGTSVSASAAVQLFNFKADEAGNPDEAAFTSMLFSAGGINVTVTPGASYNDPLVWIDDKGLGVTDEDDFRGELEDTYSGDSLNETLTFTFDTLVTIGGIGFEDWVDGLDNHRVQISYGGGAVSGSFEIAGEGDIDDGDDIFSMGILSTSAISWFTVTPIEELDGGNTDVYIYGLYDVTAVPVPAAAWLFGSAILGLACTKRRQ